MKLKIALLPIAVFAFCTQCRADTFTIWLTPTNLVDNAYTNFFVPINVVAAIKSVQIPPTYVGGYGVQLAISFNGQSNVYFPMSTGDIAVHPTFVGPATITLSGSYGPAFCTIETSCANPVQFIPSTAVVIPSDTNGPVSIVLESSTDLINWTPTLPGKYGTTSTNRFFRVRAER